MALLSCSVLPGKFDSLNLSHNWLRVLGSAELAQIDQRVCHQLHAIMPLLDTFKTEQESLEWAHW
jgi:hypothetical protein